jgi:hypothetical protein
VRSSDQFFEWKVLSKRNRGAFFDEIAREIRDDVLMWVLQLVFNLEECGTSECENPIQSQSLSRIPGHNDFSERLRRISCNRIRV